MKKIIIYLIICGLISPVLSAMIFTNEGSGPEGITFILIMRGRKYSDRQEIFVPPGASKKEFFFRWQKRHGGTLFQVNVKEGRNQKNCAVQKGYVDHYEVIYRDGRCQLRRI